MKLRIYVIWAIVAAGATGCGPLEDGSGSPDSISGSKGSSEIESEHNAEADRADPYTGFAREQAERWKNLATRIESSETSRREATARQEGTGK